MCFVVPATSMKTLANFTPSQYAIKQRKALAHSTHQKGSGAFVKGVEQPRITVALATGISTALCRQVDFGHYNPEGHDIKTLLQEQNVGALC